MNEKASSIKNVNSINNRKRAKISAIPKVLALLCITLLISAGILPISAANPISDANYAKSKAVRDELDAEMEAYLNLDTTDGKYVSHRTNSLIGEYSKQAIDLYSTPASQTEDLTEEFDLLLAKGKLAGKIGWIAHFHTNATPNATVLAKLSELRMKLDAKISSEDLLDGSDFSNTVCIEMNRAVFREKLHAQAREDDGKMTAAIFENGVSKIELCSYAGIDGAEFLSLYNETMRVVTLQRTRDGAARELEAVYSILKGNGSFSDDPYVKEFFAAVDGNIHVDESLSVKDINNALISAAKKLADEAVPEGSRYVFAYRELLKSKFDMDAAQASAIGTFAPISQNLKTFETDLYRAQTKDKVASLILANETNTDLLGLISEYTDNGGILDRCTAKSAMDAEYVRAGVRVSWYREYAACKQAIEDILYLPAKDISDKLVTKAKEIIYLSTDNEIKEVDVLSENRDELFQSIVKKGRLSLDDLLCEAKAERFRIDHKEILEDAFIDESDRVRLEEAMSKYDHIMKTDELTAKKLTAEKRSLNEKYKTLIKAGITARANGKDAASLVSALESLSGDLAPYALKTLADEFILRADSLGTLQKMYESFTKDSQAYPSYDSDSKAAFEQIYRSSADAIIASKADELSLSDVLAKINADSERSFERQDAIAKIRLAAKGSSLSDVKATLEAAIKAINEEVSISEIRLIRDGAIFRIGCQIKAETMRGLINSLKTEIDGLRALDSVSKTELKGEADLLFSLCNSAASASDTTALDNIVKDFENKLSALKEKAENASLTEGKRQAIEEVKRKITDIKNTIDGYSFINYVTAGTSAEMLTRLYAIEKSFEKNALDSSTGWKELDTLKASALNDAEKVMTDASSAELNGARTAAKDTVNASLLSPDHYSTENQAKIEEIVLTGFEKLDAAQSVEEIASIRDAILSETEDVSDLLDEAKAEAFNKLNSLYAALSKYKDCYSAEVWEQIEQLYRSATDEISQISAFEDREKATALADECCALMKEKRKDKVNSEALDAITGGSYPSGYDTSLNGFAASLTSKGQILSDATFSVFPISDTNAARLINKAVKEKKVFLADGSLAQKTILNSLRGCNILTGLDIRYSNADGTGGPYSVSLILPDGMNVTGLVGIVYIRTDGSIEYFKHSLNGKELSFDIPHLSSFYIVSEKTVDLSPVIIMLSIIFLFEAALIALLLLRRKNKVRERVLASYIPFLPISALVNITPKGALPAIIILGILVLGAGGLLLRLVSDELKRSKKPQAEKQTEKQTDDGFNSSNELPASKEKRRVLKERSPIPALTRPEKSNAEHSQITAPSEKGSVSSDKKKNEKVNESNSKSQDNELFKSDDLEKEDKLAQNSEATDELPLSSILKDTSPLLVLDTVSVEEANDLMSDEEAQASLFEASSDILPYSSRYASHGKKHEVNIDMISSAFKPNETVSLDSLKEKGLVPKNARAVKILARGTLDKPLTVIAQDFSTAAVKMITLTGGHAVVVEKE